MATKRVRLSEIPQRIQQQYNIGPEVEADADNRVMGGHFTFVNNGGQTVGVDAVELTGTGIKIKEL